MTTNRTLAARLGRLARACAALGPYNGVKLAVMSRLSNGLVTLRPPQLQTPLIVRGRTTDDTVVEQIFVAGEYDGIAAFSPRTILDAGANCGASTAYFAALYPEADIVAIEPEPSNFSIMQINLASYENVALVPGALWSHRCVLQLSSADTPKYSFRVGEAAPSFPGADTEAYGIEDIMQLRGWRAIDLLKLDVEGAEATIFSSPRAQAWIDKVRVIAIELHEDIAPGCAKVLFSLLKDRDYRVRVSGEHLVID